MLKPSLLGHPFCGFPITHPRIIQPGGDQQIGILFLLDIIVGRVRCHVVEIFWIFRVAPFFVLRHRERQRGIRHGVQEVDERDGGDNAREQVRAHVHHRAHQKAARASAQNRHPLRRRVPLINQSIERS